MTSEQTLDERVIMLEQRLDAMQKTEERYRMITATLCMMVFGSHDVANGKLTVEEINAIREQLVETRDADVAIAKLVRQ